MLLRNNMQMALNQVETLCIESADHYATAAGQTENTELTQLFSELAQQRKEIAADLAMQIRALDDLPQQPDPDKEAVEHLLTGIKMFFSGDERSILIDEREQFEQNIMQAVHAAMRESLPEDTKNVLRNLLSHIDITKRQLADAR
jgi:uncharacterized protein (TIGR02284 family)